MQRSLLIMVPITSGRLDDLERLLADIANPPGGEDLEVNPIIPFRKLETVHFARILIHHASPSAEAPVPESKGTAQASGPVIVAKLLFSTDYDGALSEHLDEWLREAGPGLDSLFGHCDGWPGHQQRDAAHQFFLRTEVVSNTFYTGTMNRSVAQIRREAELREHIEHYLDAHANTPGFPSDPVLIRERIRQWVSDQKAFEWVKERPGPFPKPLLPPFVTNNLTLTAASAVLGLSALAGAILRPVAGFWGATGVVIGTLTLVVGAGFAYLSYLAAHDPVIIRDDVQDHTARLVQTEDRIVQNEMSSVIYIKRPLWFRRFVLKAVLAFIDSTAKYLSNQGTLAGIPSIHFARWVVVDEGRRLVFFSNFDGSWENYLGDFIDKAHSGLTAVWSNCVGFPRTKGLAGMGATDEQRFKAYSRQSQVPTQVWYSAYRWLTVSNVNDNTRLRLGLDGGMTAAEAQDWLRASVQRKANALPRHSSVGGAAVDVADVQGLVARSYQPLKEAVYLPVIFDPQRRSEMKAWVGELASIVTAASRSSASVSTDGRAVNVAFSYGGLQMLGVEQHETRGFSREFREGMAEAHRQRLLGDTGPADPATWKWGGPANRIEAMLFVFADSPRRLTALRTEEEARAARHGVTLGKPLETSWLPDDKEHFGFHDGIAQPRIEGLKGGGTPSVQGSTIPPGEVILGYANAYGIMPISATVRDEPASRQFLEPAPGDPGEPGSLPWRDLGRNGSYVIFRQLRQDVRAFWDYVDRRAESDRQRRKWLAAKMVGRWPNGAPLVQYPDREPERFDEKTANAFWYRHDLAGDRCPIGAHIRRSNPRDGLLTNRADSLLVADRHRLLRRGRAYGRPLAASFDPEDILSAPDDSGDQRGLHFICFNTDIARQFEFVQSTWLNNMKFDGLYADPDPIAAPHVDAGTAHHDEEIPAFTVQACPVRHRVHGLPRFVTMVGGAYLFMPGLKALKYLAQS